MNVKILKKGGIIIEIRVLTYFLAVAREENITKAAEMLQYALNSNPSDAFACLTLGKMCHDIGKHENVALFLEQAIKCDSI